MKPERLTHRLIVERNSDTAVEGGFLDATWTEFARTRAELVEGGAAEEQQDRGTVSVTAYTFRARYVPGVTLADRVIHGGKAFNIVGLAEIGRREGLDIKVRRTGA